MRIAGARADFGFVSTPPVETRRTYFRARYLPQAIETKRRQLRALLVEAAELGLTIPEGTDA